MKPTPRDPAHRVPERLHFIWLGGGLTGADAVTAGHFGARSEVLLTTDRPVAALRAGLSLHGPVEDDARVLTSFKPGPFRYRDDRVEIDRMASTRHQRLGAGSLDSSTLNMRLRHGGPSSPMAAGRSLQVQTREAAFAARHDRSLPEDQRRETEVLHLMAALDSVGAVNYGAASDVVRVELLKQHGGLYMDFDTAEGLMKLWHEEPDAGAFPPLAGDVHAPLGHLNHRAWTNRRQHNNDLIAAALPAPDMPHSMRELGRRMVAAQVAMGQRAAFTMPTHFGPDAIGVREADIERALLAGSSIYEHVQVPAGSIDLRPSQLLSGRDAATLADQRRLPPPGAFSMRFAVTMVATGPEALQETNLALARATGQAQSYPAGPTHFTREVFTDMRELRQRLSQTADRMDRIPSRQSWSRSTPPRAFEAPF